MDDNEVVGASVTGVPTFGRTAKKVLLGCEFSGAVRRAFRALGHNAWSCDVLPAEDGGEHIQADVRTVLGDGWDIGIFFPPCTYLATSGAKHMATRPPHLMDDALDLVRALLNAPIDSIGLENPRSVISTRVRPKDQVIRPYQFGEKEVRQTWLWLKNLPKLQPTHLLEVPPYGSDEWKRWNRVHRHASPGPNRWKQRSRTLPGIAAAMAAQWGGQILEGQAESGPILETAGVS